MVHMLPVVRFCSATLSRTTMQLMAIHARRWALSGYTSRLQSCASMPAKGIALGRRLRGVRVHGMSTSPIVHIVHD